MKQCMDVWHRGETSQFLTFAPAVRTREQTQSAKVHLILKCEILYEQYLNS
jgi:hypothetical protein